MLLNKNDDIELHIDSVSLTGSGVGRYKIHLSRLAGACSGKPGEIIESGKRLVVSCGDGNAVEILVLQAPGKRAMPAQDFLRGNPIEKGAFFE